MCLICLPGTLGSLVLGYLLEVSCIGRQEWGQLVKTKEAKDSMQHSRNDPIRRQGKDKLWSITRASITIALLYAL